MHSLERIVALSPRCPSGMGMHCDHTMHFSADLGLQLDSPVYMAP